VARLYPQALGSRFVTSYDSEGYGGGIRHRLDMGCLHSDLSGILCSVSISKEIPVEHLHTRKRSLGFQESTSMETRLSTRSLAMGLHITLYLR
jgi:hypothetical protein